MFVQQRKRHHRHQEHSNSSSLSSGSSSYTSSPITISVETGCQWTPAGSAAAPGPIELGPSELISAASQAASGADTLPASADKRMYPCRICGLRLSSASNRVRHERAKHKSSATVGMKRSLGHALSESSELQETDGHDIEPKSPQFKSSNVQPSSSAGPAVTVHAIGSQLETVDMDFEMDHGECSASSGSDYEPTGEDLVQAELASDFRLPPPNASSSRPAAQDSHTEPAVALVREIDLGGVAGLRPLLQEEHLQACCYPFLVWLSHPPITQCEALVKARRVKSLTQLQPIKSNLRFIMALLYEHEAIAKVDLQQLTQLSICQTLFQAMTNRQAGSGRIHAVFLLLKKVLVFLSSQESAARRQFIQPSTYESFLFVDSICSDSSHRRKQESRNRALLGVQASQSLHKSQPMPAHQAFVVPMQWTSKASSAVEPPSSNNSTGTPPPSARAEPAASSTSHSDDQPPSNELGKEELQRVAKGCVDFLQARMEVHAHNQSDASVAAAAASNESSLQSDRLFMAHLVTATLCLGLAPRSQVLKQLRIGSSFIKQADGRFWVKILAELSKNGKPTLFAISSQLTSAFDHYFAVVRPRLVAQAQEIHDYVFVKHNGTAPRADFSACTCQVTHGLIGRPVNAHAFRSAVVTAFYETGASQSEMDVLATIMAHDPTTAKNFYYRPQIAAAAVQTNDRMAELLLK